VKILWLIKSKKYRVIISHQPFKLCLLSLYFFEYFADIKNLNVRHFWAMSFIQTQTQTDRWQTDTDIHTPKALPRKARFKSRNKQLVCPHCLLSLEHLIFITTFLFKSLGWLRAQKYPYINIHMWSKVCYFIGKVVFQQLDICIQSSSQRWRRDSVQQERED
jgi:hypothetical protein